MQIGQTIQKILSNWHGFPNLTADGKYEFLTQTVVANSVESQHLINFRQNPKDSYLLKKIYKVFVHEITHWLDHTSTLWGQNNLVTIYNAFNAFESQKEDELWRVIQLFSEVSRNHFADYYQVDGPAIVSDWTKRPWRYKYSFGLQYGSDGRPRSDRPFISTRFSNFDNVFIKRVPISVVSLMETIATAAELQVEFSYILPLLKTQLSADEFLVESKLFEQACLERVYNPSLTVYSVATHCLANFMSINNISLAYELSSALSSLCLNLPSQVFGQLKISQEFQEKHLPVEIQEITTERASQMIAMQDRGFAFFVLSEYAPKTDFSTVLDWLEKTIESAGLPPIADLQEMVIHEMRSLENNILDGPLVPRLKNLLEIGRRNYVNRGIFGKHEPCLNSLFLMSQDLKLPPVILGDENIFDVELASGSSQYSYSDIENWVFYIYDFEERLREFQRACIAI
ncbi:MULTISPECIES: hypothetical protein [unclassified Microcoleus]|uniref:hypothetical protein n=1 Tax=unclassified Microcoleus TaxID=2642155 RepID=UPI002FD4E0A9